MKKRIAIFANGWGTEYLCETVEGVSQIAKEANYDVFAFVDHSIYIDEKRLNKGECNIFRLPDLQDFDGAVLMANSFNMQEEVDFVYKAVKDAGIPTISIEYKFDDIPTMNTDNYNGMHELAEHLVQKHGAKHIVYIGGPEEHLESNIRLQAVRDVAKEHGITLREEDIMYGDWAKNGAKRMSGEWVERNGKFPDAFICANDVMAMGVCEMVTERGYKVPENVMVTGYDCTKLGQEFDPMIASVNHEWVAMGRQAMNYLLDMMDGKKVMYIPDMKTRFVPGGSCGCEWEYIDVKDGRGYRPRRFEGSLCDSHFRHIYLAIRKDENATELNRSLDNLFGKEHWMEGSDFMLCLEPEFFHIVEGDENLRVEGYSGVVDVICSLKDGKPRPHEIMSCKDAMFRTANEKEEPGVYVFLPVHSEGRTCGFSMITRSLDIAEDNYLYSFTRHMNQYLEQVRRNITIADLTERLRKLSVMDSLMDIYNRAGCEKIAYPMLKEALSNGRNGVIFIADIDRMKTINDKYGHASGDKALITVANVLKRMMPPQWVISRFGGDEFFVGGVLTEEMDLDAFTNSLLDELDREIERQNIKFHLSVSIGYTKLVPGDEENLEENLQKADHFMYEIKQRHHEEIDGE